MLTIDLPHVLMQGQVDVPKEAKSDAVAIAAGCFHLLVLLSSGKVLAWGGTGINDFGQAKVPEAALSGVKAFQRVVFNP